MSPVIVARISTSGHHPRNDKKFENQYRVQIIQREGTYWRPANSWYWKMKDYLWQRLSNQGNIVNRNRKRFDTMCIRAANYCPWNNWERPGNRLKNSKGLNTKGIVRTCLLIFIACFMFYDISFLLFDFALCVFIFHSASMLNSSSDGISLRNFFLNKLFNRQIETI